MRKRSTILCNFFCLAALCLTLLPAACSAEPPEDPSPSEETAYYGATVLLIDHDNGAIGVAYEDEVTGESKKLMFRVDLDEVYVTNPLNQFFEFTDISPGDQVDLFAVRDDSGEETVIDVVTYSQYE